MMSLLKPAIIYTQKSRLMMANSKLLLFETQGLSNAEVIAMRSPRPKRLDVPEEL